MVDFDQGTREQLHMDVVSRAVRTAIALACCVAVVACEEKVDSGAVADDHVEEVTTTAVVQRVIDGDTFVATVDGRVETIRLLNVDTPETKDPDGPVECLGAEATAYLKDRLPPGTSVTLEYDLERRDRYGRTLAGVQVNGSLVNADIAEQGLGVAVVYEPNRRFYRAVVAAQERAAAAARGLYDPTAGCTLPAEVADAITQLGVLSTQRPSDVSTAIAALSVASATFDNADRVHRLLDGRTRTALLSHFLIDGYTEVQRQGWRSELAAAKTSAEKHRSRLRGDLKNYREAEAAARKRRAEEVNRQKAAEAEKRRRAEAEAAARRAKEREAARRRAAQPNESERRAAPKRQQPKKAPQRQGSKKNGSQQNPYPGYTGPRCYEPGGKTWRPC